MGNNCNYCTCCKETNHSKSSEDFEIKKIDEFGKASDAKNNSCKSISIENLSQLKAEIVISANTSLIEFYSNSLETPEKEYSDNKNLIKRGVSLNTINEKTDSDLNEYLNSKLFETEEFSKINLTIPGNLSLDFQLSSQNLNETMYKGELDNQGRPHGKGLQIDRSGNKYIGYFYEGLPHGMGRLEQKSGEVFQGEFKNGQLNGIAAYTSPDGKKYSGNYCNGKLTGLDGSVYIGLFHSDKPHGKGKKI